MSDGDWSDSRKWQMDLLKSAIAFTLAGVVSLFVVDKLQAERATEKARADAFYTTRLKALDDFRTASVKYDLAGHTAYTELYQWHGKEKVKAMLLYEQESYPTWKLSLETIAQLFPSQSKNVDAILYTNRKRDAIYRVWLNWRLDAKEVDVPLAP